MIKIFAAAALMLALGSCQSGSGGGNSQTLTTPPGTTGQSNYIPIRFESQTATADERAACEAAGGEIQQGGLLGGEICVQTFADAGQSCTDSSQCMGLCLAAGDFVVGNSQPVTGQCKADDNPFGCYQEVENGSPLGALCVD